MNDVDCKDLVGIGGAGNYLTISLWDPMTSYYLASYLPFMNKHHSSIRVVDIPARI